MLDIEQNVLCYIHQEMKFIEKILFHSLNLMDISIKFIVEISVYFQNYFWTIKLFIMM